MKPRDYQTAAVGAVLADLKTHRKCLIVLPTGSGKSILAAMLLARLADAGRRGLLLADRKELIEQNERTLNRYRPDLSSGVISAGLKRDERGHALTFAGVQTLHARLKHLTDAEKAVDLLLIDEAHMIRATDGRFIDVIRSIEAINPKLRVVGLTASPFRLDSGSLVNKSAGGFEKISFEAPVRGLVERGFLSPLVCYQPPSEQIDLSGVRTLAGEFHAGDLEKAALKAVARTAQDASRRLTTDLAARKSVLVFAAGVDHARAIAKLFNAAGIPTDSVVGSDIDRDQKIADFKAGRLRALVSVNLLLVGFDHPEIDVIVDMRPTKSVVLYIQSRGRGFRIAPGKANCIAEGQRVLTDCGLVPIEKLTTEMRVWDGCAFVQHAGAVCLGEQKVINYAGLIATPDHRVWTQEGWKEIGLCALQQTPIAVTGIGGEEIREADGYFRTDTEAQFLERAAGSNQVFGLRNRERAPLSECEEERCWLQDMRTEAFGAEMASAPLQYCEAALHEPEEHELCDLWRQRDQVHVPVSAGDGGVDTKETRYSPRSADRQDQQRRTLRSGEHSFVHATSKHGAHDEDKTHCPSSHLSPEISGSQICGFDTQKYVQSGNVRQGHHREIQPPVTQTKRKVWDVLNAGPLRRFTVEGLLVHNCQILDYSGNTLEHGPVDNMTITGGKNGRSGAAPQKACPKCGFVQAAGTLVCKCGHTFERQRAPLFAAPVAAPVMGPTGPRWMKVQRMAASLHHSKSDPTKPTTLALTFSVGLQRVTIYLSLDQARANPYAYLKSCAVWRQLSARPGTPPPATILEAITRFKTGELKTPAQIYAQRKGNWWEIDAYDTEPVPLVATP